jgi:hypothetical protein
MKAQLYDDADYVRIFDLSQQAWAQAIMDCHSTENAPIGLDAADLAIRRCGLRRKSKWTRYPHGHFFEAQVSFK